MTTPRKHTMHRTHALPLAALLILTVVPTERVGAQNQTEGFSDDRLARVDEAMERYVNDGEVPGIVGLIARRGKIVYHKSFGYRDVEAKAHMSNDVIFRIASMTKPIASVAAMMLWEEGRFQLRDPVSKFLPEFADMKVAVPVRPGDSARGAYRTVEASRQITVQHLLTHTAGLPNPYRGVTRELYGEVRANRKPDGTVGDYVTALAGLPLNFEPGSHWEYGPATDVIGRLVEVLSGKTLDVYLKERILKPLGMHDTHFYLPASKVPRLAALYEPDAEGKIRLQEKPDSNSRWVKEPHVYFSAGGGLVSTTTDYFRFHQMMLNGGVLDGVRILGPRTVRLMTANHTGDKPVWLRGPGFGFGLGYSVTVDQGPSGMPSGEGTYGWGGAYCTVFWVDPQDQLVGILMTQVRPYTHLNIRQDFQTLAYQALLE
ncbi:MAG: serine hydrolase [Bryobacterales bacterium]|nr:serine hydrolase [Bryobacterales bacterium]MDE0625036.1 serine hydrolase [Bryobacterales bacterium]